MHCSSLLNVGLGCMDYPVSIHFTQAKGIRLVHCEVLCIHTCMTTCRIVHIMATCFHFPVSHVAFISSTTSSELHNATFGICMSSYCFGGTLSYFLAAYIPVFFNLLALLMLMVLGALLYLTGVAIYMKLTCKCKAAHRDTASDMQAIAS